MNILPVAPPGGQLPVTGASGAVVSDVSGTATVKGNVADGASAVATVLDNLVALANAGAKLCSVRVNGVEKTYLDLNGCLIFLTASPFLKTLTTNAAIQVLGNRNSSGSGTDVIVGGQATRTAGRLLDVQHAGGVQVGWDFNGKCVPGTVAATKTAGAAWSGSAALDTNGTVTIATTAVTAASIIMLNCSAVGGTVGGIYRAATADIVAGTSFIIRAFVASTAGAVTAATTDTSTIQWWIIN